MHLIDSLIVASYLIGLLLFAFFYKSNIKTIEEYAVGKRDYNSFFVTATMLATLIGGGSTLGLSTKVYEYGFLFILIPMASSLRQILISFFLITPIRKLNQKAISMGDLMQLWYGIEGRIITGLAATFLNIAFVAAQIAATGYLLELFIGIPYQIGAFIAMGIMTLYSSTGGVKAVVLTDVIQAILLIIALPLLTFLALLHLDLHELPALLKTTRHFSSSDLINLFTTLFIGGALFPDYIQRLLFSSSNKTALHSTLSTALLAIPIYLMIALIGVAAFTLTSASINPNYAMLHLIKAVVPTGLIGLMIIALLGITMSTADTGLNNASIALTQDILSPLFSRYKFSSQKWLKLTKNLTFFMGIAVIFVALYMERIIDLIFASFSFWAPLIIVPFIAGLYGKKISKQAYLFTSLSSVLLTLFWQMQGQLYYSWLSPVLLGTFWHGLSFAYFYYKNKNHPKIIGR